MGKKKNSITFLEMKVYMIYTVVLSSAKINNARLTLVFEGLYSKFTLLFFRLIIMMSWFGDFPEVIFMSSPSVISFFF